MKDPISKRDSVTVLVASLGLALTVPASSQTLTVLHDFAGVDGDYPVAALTLSGSTLFGTTLRGGSSGVGTVFRVNTDGTGFTNLHSFSYDDGGLPSCGLALSSNTLYGTTYGGGPKMEGNVFAINTDGTGFTNLYSFNKSSDGATPYDTLVLASNTLYGTTSSGGTGNNGTVFKVKTDGTGFVNLHTFTPTAYPAYTNSDGASPNGGMALSGNSLYGTAGSGGAFGHGTVFRVNTDATGFTNLYSFNGTDGADPIGDLILFDGSLYGTTQTGGYIHLGTLFRVNTDGTGFTNLHYFNGNDGAEPYAALNVLGNTLYGTAQSGVLFSINPDGSGFTNLYRLSGTDGVGTQGGVIRSGYTLYGTASQGGTSGNGTVFAVAFAPQLAISGSETSVILSWPTNTPGFSYTGFALQSSENSGSAAAWTNVSAGTSVLNGRFVVTNPISDTHRFYRLRQ